MSLLFYVNENLAITSYQFGVTEVNGATTYFENDSVRAEKIKKLLSSDCDELVVLNDDFTLPEDWEGVANRKLSTYTLEVDCEKTKIEINTTYTQRIKAIIGDIPQSEIDTWSKQEAQALVWQADNNAAVPFIQNLAIERNLKLSELVSRILEKVTIYEDLSSKALGQKHASEDAMEL